MNISLCKQQKILSDVLSSLNFPILAEEALKETNIEILKGYARIAEIRARNKQEYHALNLMSLFELIPQNKN